MVLGLSPDTGKAVEIEVSDGRIRALSESDRDAKDLWVAPGLIDIQVNGYGGVDFNKDDLTGEEIARSIRALRSTGVTRFLPTIITGPASRMTGAARNLARARHELDEAPSIAGIHIEGP